LSFDAVCICPHRPADNCACRKPKVGMVQPYLAGARVDFTGSAVIGDRLTDLEFARNLGVRGLRVQLAGAANETWPAIADELLSRRATFSRKTKETDIEVSVNLDGTGVSDVATGIGFFDHMLDLLARHSRIDLTVKAVGDLHVDHHHTTEDVGIALGQAVKQALGTMAGITRYASIHMPMDETLSRVVIDISGRPVLVFKVEFPRDKVGQFDTELVREWFNAFAINAGVTLHVETLYGENSHHIAESCFKGLARALRDAVAIDPRNAGEVPSTKGQLGG